MTVRFACGHQVTVEATGDERPVCHCGETRISRVDAPPPRIRGVGTSPLQKG
jgi:hypothetical protein